jgi:hypothetical protein
MTAISEAEARARIVLGANKTGCGCVGFLWRLTEGGDGWHCYRCEPMPHVEAPVRDLELLNAGRAPLAVLRVKLAQ